MSEEDFIVSKAGLDGQALAALCATTRENGAAAFGGHACTEAMRLCALASVRLVCALHIYYLSTCVLSNR